MAALILMECQVQQRLTLQALARNQPSLPANTQHQVPSLFALSAFMFSVTSMQTVGQQKLDPS